MDVNRGGLDLHVGDYATVKIEDIQSTPHVIIASLSCGGKVFRGVLMDSDSVGDLRAQQEAEIKSRKNCYSRETPSVEAKSWDDCLNGMTRKRGRKPAWKVYHPENGPCDTCSICKVSSPSLTFTHPALWKNVPAETLKAFNIEAESCVCHTCYMTRVKRGGAGPLANVRPGSCDTAATCSSEDGRHEAKRKLSGGPLYEAKRGRCHHWKTVHLDRGACTICHVCGNAPNPPRVTHPMSWHFSLHQEAVRIGLDQASCVCYPCHDLLRYGSISPGEVAVPGTPSGSYSSDQSDAHSTSPIFVITDNCVAFESPRKSSSSEQSDNNGDSGKDSPTERMDTDTVQSFPNQCPIPNCTNPIYCNIEYATRPMTAAVFDVNVDSLPKSRELYLCFNHYHSCERKLREIPCIYCQTKPTPTDPHSPYTNVIHMRRYLKELGKSAVFPPMAKICDSCLSRQLPVQSGRGSCSIQTVQL